MRILIIGGTGFIGLPLTHILFERGHDVIPMARRRSEDVSAYGDQLIADITTQTDEAWDKALTGIDTVIQLGDGFNAYEHLPAELKSEEATARLEATLGLARAVSRNHVPNYIFLSTIKAVCGVAFEGTIDDHTDANPTSLYGHLKLTVERKISEIAASSATRFIALRFPVVFGEKSDGNFIKLLQLADTSLPLPFKSLTARRSLISLPTLIHAIQQVTENKGAASNTYVVHQGAISIADLITTLRRGLDRPPQLFHIPAAAWGPIERLPKVGNLAQRFTRPLEISDENFRRNFAWSPEGSLSDALVDAARSFKSTEPT